ncbi:NUDIX hydrolase [Candidatus Gracilibacteria bacterium]|nr:NUDIX hydrolase [Candidatus Gracilibacteria bacterium]
MTATTVFSAKAILRNPEGKFALCMKEMLVNGELHSRFDIPGGGIDHGEDALTTLRREILEEMGLQATHINPRPKYFCIGESSDGNTPLVLVFYEVEVENFNYTPTEECREMRFFTLDEALESDIYHAVRTSLEEVKRLFGEF